MNNRLKYVLCFVSATALLMLQSCVGCSNSGRSKIIAKAKAEASKNNTVPVPNSIVKNVEPVIVKFEDIVTPKEEKSIKDNLIKDKIPSVRGKLIQVEGLVLKEVMELTIELKTSSSQIEQIFALQNYVQSKWHYVFDPNTGSDTWRSAEATLSLKYQGQYSGDCDDFAILIASMARQIGLESRMVAGFDGESGHAFAEFLISKQDFSNKLKSSYDYRKDDEGIWISLDWFKGKEHNRFLNDIQIYENI
jgi:hypothetical protein